MSPNPPAEQLSQLSNPLATPEQLSSSGSQLDGIPQDLEDSIRYAGARLLQAAGILLRLPQDIVAQAIVTFTRFWVGSEGGSMKEFGASEISAAALYLTAKLSADPKSPRSLLNVYAYLESFRFTFVDAETYAEMNDADAYYLSEGDYQNRRTTLMRNEAFILRVLSFQTHVALPHTLAINYLQTLDVCKDRSAREQLCRHVFAQLNTLLFSPQLVYLTHQPAQLATAAIYLAARQMGHKLPAGEWWEVFDTDREELGFLVVAMLSMPGFVVEEKQMWAEKTAPLTVKAVQAELDSGQA